MHTRRRSTCTLFSQQKARGATRCFALTAAFCVLPRWLRGQGTRLQCRRPRLHRWVRKAPWRREWLPAPHARGLQSFWYQGSVLWKTISPRTCSAQAVMQVRGSSCQHKWSFVCSPGAHLLLSDLVPLVHTIKTITDLYRHNTGVIRLRRKQGVSGVSISLKTDMPSLSLDSESLVVHHGYQ